MHGALIQDILFLIMVFQVSVSSTGRNHRLCSDYYYMLSHRKFP
jgi:hypothetical protein